jgi:hypothetical protein
MLILSSCQHGVKRKIKIIVAIVPAGCKIYCVMDAVLLREARRELARAGGIARAKSMTAKERRESARKASQAAAEVRRKKARERRKSAAK